MDTSDSLTVIKLLKSIEELLSEQVSVLKDIRAGVAQSNTKLETIKRQGY